MNKFLAGILDFSKHQIVPDDKFVRFAFQYNLPNLETLFESLKIIDCLFFFSKPSDAGKFLSIGSIKDVNIDELVAKISAGNFESNFIIDANHSLQIPNYIPLVLGAAKFPSDKNECGWNGFSDSKWFIPQVLLYEDSTSSFIIFHYFGNKPPIDFFERVIISITKSSTETKQSKTRFELLHSTEIERWTNAVNFALNEIRNNNIEKVVLARKIQLKLKSCFSISFALLQLQHKYLDCATFAYKEKDATFFGSTPEKLFSLNGKVLETEALAGSISRGLNNEEDLIKEKKLLNDTKEMNEHKNVLSFLIERLEKFTENVSCALQPQIKKLYNIQHLQTHITAKLKDEVGILELQKAIHPTPAVCGLPQKNALELIKELEYFERGLYAGVIGWFNEKKRAEFFVGIRSALLKENILTAFAGSGIVEGSDPISEYYETELKLRPILSLLENEIINQS
ncbi:MAG: menaquinone-specific isochorismate synthase [Ignavibacteria bacterium]|nr:MAG: menaquinone-specific isochorismate synthase [Ignavibacteria bacterium]KAF0160819.1 MAG: menaquinone-specific isochorismate synthase [Ignavibacteria bacterium]